MSNKEPTFSDFRGDGDLPFPTTVDREAFDGRGFDDPRDPLGGYGQEDDVISDEYPDDDGYGYEEEGWAEEDEGPVGAPYDDYEDGEEADELMGPEPEGGYYYEAAAVAAAPQKKAIPWKTRRFSVCILGSLSGFNGDTSLASAQIEEELKGSQKLKELKKSTDFLGGIRVVKARNAFPVTIGVRASLLDEKSKDKIEGNLISKGQSECLSFDMYPKASISPDHPEVILERPETVKKPILAAYKTHEKPELRKYADPSRLYEGIANNPSSPVTKYVSASHPVMVEMEKTARRRCKYFGKPYSRQAEFGHVHGGNYTIDRTDVDRQIQKLQDDHARVNYVSDLPRLSLGLMRTQLSDASASRSQLRTTWRDRYEVAADLPATDDGERELERRFDAVHKAYFTVEYDYLPQKLVPSS